MHYLLKSTIESARVTLIASWLLLTGHPRRAWRVFWALK